MKKWPFLLLACTAALLLFVGCGDQSGSGASSASSGAASSAASSTASSAAEAGAEDAVVYENAQLGIRFELPAVFRDHLEVEESTEEMGGEPVNVLYILYQDEDESAIIYRIEEMSSELWARMQEEEGPKGMELGLRDGRAVVYYPPQSNPFEQGTDAHEAMQILPDQASVLPDSFSFIE